jgi:prolipoprotein diacylglyceryltransferase
MGMWPALHVHIAGTHVVVSTHPLVVCVAVIVGVAVAARRTLHPTTVLATAPLVAVAALGGSRALFWLLRGGSADPLGGGLASMGGLAAGLLAIALSARLARVPLASLLDAFAPAGVLALGIGRLGCFLAGCCYGAPSDLPWAVVFPGVDVMPRHPLQLYSAVADFAVVAIAVRGRGPAGAVAARCAVGLGAVRCVLELLRDAGTTNALPYGGITLAQVGALALVAGGARVSWRLRRRAEAERDPEALGDIGPRHRERPARAEPERVGLRGRAVARRRWAGSQVDAVPAVVGDAEAQLATGEPRLLHDASHPANRARHVLRT